MGRTDETMRPKASARKMRKDDVMIVSVKFTGDVALARSLELYAK
jgi:hypothetical protein